MQKTSFHSVFKVNNKREILEFPYVLNVKSMKLEMLLLNVRTTTLCVIVGLE